jgi:pimeloyl-ACP methyl ester carboxylesterase
VATTLTATTPDGHELWAGASGAPGGSPVLLVMGAASSSAVWPPALAARRVTVPGMGHALPSAVDSARGAAR